MFVQWRNRHSFVIISINYTENGFHPKENARVREEVLKQTKPHFYSSWMVL